MGCSGWRSFCEIECILMTWMICTTYETRIMEASAYGRGIGAELVNTHNFMEVVMESRVKSISRST